VASVNENCWSEAVTRIVCELSNFSTLCAGHFGKSLSATFFRTGCDRAEQQLARRPLMRWSGMQRTNANRSYWLRPLPTQSRTNDISRGMRSRVGDSCHASTWGLHGNCHWCRWWNRSRTRGGIRVELIAEYYWRLADSLKRRSQIRQVEIGDLNRNAKWCRRFSIGRRGWRAVCQRSPV
jgi:hypothetical protein